MMMKMNSTFRPKFQIFVRIIHHDEAELHSFDPPALQPKRQATKHRDFPVLLV